MRDDPARWVKPWGGSRRGWGAIVGDREAASEVEGKVDGGVSQTRGENTPKAAERSGPIRAEAGPWIGRRGHCDLTRRSGGEGGHLVGMAEDKNGNVDSNPVKASR